MNDRSLNIVTLGISIVALAMSVPALWISWAQFSTDYEGAVLIQPGALPISHLKAGENEISLEVSNTSKTNLQYFLRAHSNMGFIDGQASRPQFLPSGYESQVISLSNTDAGKNSYTHSLLIEVGRGSVPMHSLSLMSDATYYLDVEIVDARNGRLLFQSRCYYRYHREVDAFRLDQPVIDTSGDSVRRQQSCRG